jgi:VCBS repeat-containing protein
MSNNKQQGGKPKATNGDDVLVGTSKNDNLSGKKGDDQISGLAGNDKLKGDKGNDLLDGGTGNDVLYGGKGDDSLLGGAGNDVLYGDDGKSKGWGWDKFCWWKPQDYDDYLDGGAGSDKVYGGKGNDVAVYSMAGNLGAGFKNIGTKDDYDGGSGQDTLELQLTYGEARLASVQQDIAAFQKFLGSKVNSRGEEFEFKSFNLDASNFEALRIELVNTSPTARADAGATNEDSLLVVAGPGVLANDSDADHLDVLSIITGGTTSANGASVVLTAGGGYSYDPTGALALQQLGQGQTTTDTFSYTIADLGGATATATVSVTVTGVNDAPVAAADSFVTDEDTALGGSVLANDTDVDSPALSASLVSGTANGALAFNGDGSFIYTPNANFFGTDSFTYTASDGALGSNVATVGLTINPVNDAPVVGDEEIVIGGGEGGDEPASQANPFLISSALLLAGITDPEGDPLFISEVSAFSELGAEVSLVDGNVVYDPTEGLKYLAEGEEVTDTFSYTVSDGQASFARFASFSATSGGTIVTASIRVTGVNDAPVAAADSFTLNEDTAFTSNVLANDIDPDSPALSASLVNGPAHGALTLNANGSFTYTPTANFFGADSFTYKASDGALDSNVATVSLTVNNVSEPNPAPPSKVLPSVSQGADLDYYIRFDHGDGAAAQWLHLESFSWGVSSSIALGGGGMIAGKAIGQDVHAMMGSSNQLVELMQSLAAGKHLEGVEIEAYAPGGDAKPQLVEQYYFEEVLLTSLQSSGSSSPIHSLSFDYAAFNRGHVTQDAKGGVSNVFEDGWDFQTAKDANGVGPAIVGDAIGSNVEGGIGGQLQYYVTFTGAQGWLELDSFSVGLTQTGSIVLGGGGGAGVVRGSPLSFSLGSSKELLLLTDGLTEGKHIQNLEIEAYTVGGDSKPQLVDQYYLEDVLVSSLSSSNASNHVSVEYGKFSHGHIEQNNKGGLEPAVESGWDFELNKAFSTNVDSDLF